MTTTSSAMTVNDQSGEYATNRKFATALIIAKENFTRAGVIAV
jgi:hypothetical protein